MGTDKRERKKAGHRARLAAEQAAQASYERRRRLIITVATPIVVLVIIGVFVLLSEGSGTATDSAAATSTTSTTASTATTSTTPKAESAAGKPCVALSELPPPDAPTVDIPLGTPPTTLQIIDVKTGTGPAVTAKDKVTVNYLGVSCSTGAIFDESYTRGQPATFGLNQVIPGWTEGLQGMQAGGIRQLVIPPEKGYGSSGQGLKIAPDETLIFVVELKSITAA
jgi:peptidylprolyl isomerase